MKNAHRVIFDALKRYSVRKDAKAAKKREKAARAEAASPSASMTSKDATTSSSVVVHTNNNKKVVRVEDRVESAALSQKSDRSNMELSQENVNTGDLRHMPLDRALQCLYHSCQPEDFSIDEIARTQRACLAIMQSLTDVLDRRK